jgi:hypothetical protein
VLHDILDPGVNLCLWQRPAQDAVTRSAVGVLPFASHADRGLPLQTQGAELHQHLQQARLRLDAIRLVVTL